MDNATQLKALQNNSVKIITEAGELTIAKLRPYAEDGHHIFQIIDVLTELILAKRIEFSKQNIFILDENQQEELKKREDGDFVKFIINILAQCTAPQNPLRAAMLGVIRHAANIDDEKVKQLTLDDITSVLLAIFEVNISFFTQTAPELLARGMQATSKAKASIG